MKNLFNNFYNRKFGSTTIGNVFDSAYIDKALVDEMIEINENAVKSLVVDPAFGSSNYGLTIIQLSDDKIEVVFADELTRPSHDDVRNFLFKKYEECSRVESINVDPSFPSEIAMIKKYIVKEEHSIGIYKKGIDESKRYGLSPSNRMKVIYLKLLAKGAKLTLLHHAKSLLEDNKQLIKINEQHCSKLVTALRSTTVENVKRDRGNMIYNDVLDSFILALSFFKFK